jgi:hypothetical protein
MVVLTLRNRLIASRAGAARSTFWPLMICRAAPAALVAAVDRVRWAASAGGSANLGLPIGSPQLAKLADYAAKLVVRGGSNRRPSAFQAHPRRRCTWLDEA